MVGEDQDESAGGAVMIEQGSMEWFAQRCGKLTASKMSDVLATTKSGPAASRANYLAQLVCERLTGKVADTYVSPDMKRGQELEPLARAAYEAVTGEMVVLAEFGTHATIADLGASPDGLVSTDGLLEIKCLNASNHIEALRNGMPSKYRPQVQTQLLVTGRQWCDFCVFHPDFPEAMQLGVYRIQADAEYHKTLVAETHKFLAEVAAEVDYLTKKYAVAA
jgi:putative phage-type endonuclease